MSILPDLFVDQTLKARQDQLNGQWAGTWNIIQGCNDFPSSDYVNFLNDKKYWDQFYASGSNWSADSKKATDEWQTKLQDWISRVKGYGCAGSVGSVGGDTVQSDTGDLGIAGVKDPPPDDPTFLSRFLSGVQNTENTFLAPLKEIGIGVAVLVVIILLALVYVLTHGKASGYGVSIG